MALTESQRHAIIKRRGRQCERDGRVHAYGSLEIHHKDRNQGNDSPRNLRVLCKRHHQELHKRAGY